MDKALGKDLGWFWYYWLWTTESVDGSIAGVTTTGDGMPPSCRTVTVVRAPVVATFAIEPSTLSVVNSQ